MMLSRISPQCNLLPGFLLWGAQTLAFAGVSSGTGDNLIIPHIFNEANAGSSVILQNLADASQDLSVEFFNQDGTFFDLITVTIPARGEAQVETPMGPTAGFRGSVLIFGNAAYVARGQWNLDLAGTPVAVGVPAIPQREAAASFQIPIGSVGADSLVGVAIENPGSSAISCTAVYRDPSGQSVGEDAYMVNGFGQISEFASQISGGFEGSATVSCSGPAAVIAVIQEQVNGFPTPLFAPPGS